MQAEVEAHTLALAEAHSKAREKEIKYSQELFYVNKALEEALEKPCNTCVARDTARDMRCLTDRAVSAQEMYQQIVISSIPDTL